MSRARKIYYDSDPEWTSLDAIDAFEGTQPGVELAPVDDDEEITGVWLLPVIGLLVGGFFLGKCWVGRKQTQTVIAGDTASGLDLLG